MNAFARGLPTAYGMMYSKEHTEYTDADSMIIVAKLVYMDPCVGPRTPDMRERWYMKRRTVRQLIKIVLARETLRYGKRRL